MLDMDRAVELLVNDVERSDYAWRAEVADALRYLVRLIGENKRQYVVTLSRRMFDAKQANIQKVVLQVTD